MPSLIAEPQTTSPQATLIRIKGTFDVTTSTQVYQQMHRMISSDHYSRLLVDLNQVEQMDSTGLMALVSALKLARKLNKQLSLCSLSQSVQMILELTQLDRVFEIVESSTIPTLLLEVGYFSY